MMPEPIFIHLLNGTASSRQLVLSMLTDNSYSLLIHPSADSFVQGLRVLPPGIVLLHLHEDRADTEVLSRLLALELTWPIVVMMGDGEDRIVFRTLSLGTPGPAGTVDEPELLRVLRAVARGGAARSSAAGAAAPSPTRLQPLSAREREVLARLAEGETHKVIARDLGISPRTVEVHRANIMRKLRLQRSADLVQVALAAGLAGPAAAEAARPLAQRPPTAA